MLDRNYDWNNLNCSGILSKLPHLIFTTDLKQVNSNHLEGSCYFINIWFLYTTIQGFSVMSPSPRGSKARIAPADACVPRLQAVMLKTQ